LARKVAMSGLSPGKSIAENSGSSPMIWATSTVANGATPRRTSWNSSWNRIPDRSKGAISARTAPRVISGKRPVQNGSSWRTYWVTFARPPITRSRVSGYVCPVAVPAKEAAAATAHSVIRMNRRI
jgi:hypothetical protein